MKAVDDYSAKLRIWAGDPNVVPLPQAVGLPRFGHKKFRSYEEMNAWKRAFLEEIASKGGVKWKKS